MFAQSRPNFSVQRQNNSCSLPEVVEPKGLIDGHELLQLFFYFLRLNCCNLWQLSIYFYIYVAIQTVYYQTA
jgi:hypothetical protein